MATDSFSEYHADLLDGTYDCADRIVLNAYYPMGHGAGGFRTWWRHLFGDDEKLDNAHLMRFAGRYSRRLRAWAKKKGIPVIRTKAKERKHELAQEYKPSDPEDEGMFVIFVSRAPASVWEVLRFDNGCLKLRKKDPMPWVNYYSFHLLDRDWGHVVIKVCGHPPFWSQIALNGHEYVAQQARRAGIGYRKEANCFTEITNAADLGRVAEALRSADAIGHLTQVCERWIYRCMCFALSYDEQERSGFRYDYSAYQIEYSRNLLFRRGWEMERVFQGLIDRTRSQLGMRSVKTLFGRRRRPRCTRRRPNPRFEVVVERPEYHLTIFKLHCGRLSLKIYTKGERVLRIEATAHNTEDLRCGKVVEKFPELVAALAGMVERFLEVLQCLDVVWIQDTTLEDLPTPSHVGKTRVGGLDVNQRRIRAVIEAVMALAWQPRGFTAREVATKVAEILRHAYHPRQAAYDLKKLRGKHLVERLGKSHRYQPSSTGLRTLAGLMVLRDKVIQPLLAGCGRRKPRRKSKNPHPLDSYYDAVQREMQNLFGALNIAAA